VPQITVILLELWRYTNYINYLLIKDSSEPVALNNASDYGANGLELG